MNNRVAKKIVKQHGLGWLVKNYRQLKSGCWIFIGDGYLIPFRWRNKLIIKWMKRRYPIN